MEGETVVTPTWLQLSWALFVSGARFCFSLRRGDLWQRSGFERSPLLAAIQRSKASLHVDKKALDIDAVPMGQERCQGTPMSAIELCCPLQVAFLEVVQSDRSLNQTLIEFRPGIFAGFPKFIEQLVGCEKASTVEEIDRSFEAGIH